MARYIAVVLLGALCACASINYPVPDPDVPSRVKSQSTGAYMDDLELERQVREFLKAVFTDKELDLQVKVFENRVFLIGSVSSKKLIARIGALVEQNFTKTRQVVNLLAYRKHFDGIYAGDLELTTKIKITLIQYGKVDASILDTFVYDKKVYLIGYATLAQCETFSVLLSRIEGVKEVIALCDVVKIDS